MDKMKMNHFEDIYWKVCSELSAKDNSDNNKKTILVVDDEPDTVFMLKTRLAHGGFNVLTAMTGEEALALLEIDCPDLMVLDLMLPGINGVEVCQQIKRVEMYKELPILILSATLDPTRAEDGLNCGADAYFPKPYNSKHLLEKIEELLECDDYPVKSSESDFRVLMIDPNPQDCKSMQRVLGQIGLENIVVVSNGSEGLAAAHKLKPHLIIAEAALSDMNGYLLCKQIKEIGGFSPKIIIVSSLSEACYTYEQVAEGIDRTYADVFLEKSPDYTTLQKVVKGLFF